MKALFFVLVLLLTVQAGAQSLTLEIPSEISYESGRSLCEKTYKSLIEHEKGFYVRVPADYARPEKGTTDIYSFFHRGFDPKKETLRGGGSPQLSPKAVYCNPTTLKFFVEVRSFTKLSIDTP